MRFSGWGTVTGLLWPLLAVAIMLMTPSSVGAQPRDRGEKTSSEGAASCTEIAAQAPAALVQLRRDAETALGEEGGPASPKYKAALQSLGRAIYGHAKQMQSKGCFAGTVAALDEMLEVMQRTLPPDNPNVVRMRNERASLLVELGRLAEAEADYLKGLQAVTGRPEAPARALNAQIENDLALLHLRRNEFQKAKQGFERALAINRSEPRGEGLEAAKNMHNIALIHVELGQYDEAEPLYVRALRLIETSSGAEHEEVARILNNIASLHRRQGLYEKAEPLYRRALAIREAIARASNAPAHPDLAQSYNNLGWLHQNLGERARDQQRPEQAKAFLAEAEAQFRRTADMLGKALGEDHERVGSARNNLAVALFDRAQLSGRSELLDEAAAQLRKAIEIRRARLGAAHPDVAQSLHRLARVTLAQGGAEAALGLHQQALAIRQKALDAEHTDIVQSHDDLAAVLGRLGRWPEARREIERARDIVIGRSRRGIHVGNFGSDERGRQEIAGSRRVFQQHARILWQLASTRAETHDAVREPAFKAAQRASQTAAEAALVQMAARQAKGTGELAGLVRRRQDIVRQWQALDDRLNAAIAAESARRNPAMEAEAERQKQALDAERATVDARLGEAFPEFTALTHPEPLSLDEVQRLLQPDEALVFVLATEEETLTWVVTRGDRRWQRAALGAAALAREVKVLRCGLDDSAWSRTDCAALLGVGAPPRNGPLPFSHARAHALYNALLGPFRGLIRDKHLLIVPTGPLAELPFQVLLSRPPQGKAQGGMAWLAKEHAITVLPAVSSLPALRRLARPSAATKPLVGFGNPLLDGDPTDAEDVRLAALSRSATLCERLAPGQAVALRAARRSAGGAVAQAGGIADLAHLRAQSPLPETARELCDVARALGTDPAEIRIGPRATEAEVKALSASGELARFRVLHFATHGTLAGELSGTSEPGLIMTPPEAPSSDDDGYLSASEIAGLKLDADWVVLSACNTAGGAGRGDGGEALSGLARAFFYAQARALLVSHWAVDSVATVKLITTSLNAVARDPRIGRAEALRRGMLSLIASADPREAHPSFWAPFAVVGEGGGGR